MKFTIGKLHDGGLVLGCGGEGMEETLIFTAGAMCDDEHPLMAKQRAILEYIVTATRVYEELCQICQAVDSRERSRYNQEQQGIMRGGSID